MKRPANQESHICTSKPSLFPGFITSITYRHILDCKSLKMGCQRLVKLLPVLAVLLSLSVASLHTPSKTSRHLGRRDDASPAGSSASAFPSCHVGTTADCPGIYPDASGSCSGKPVGTAVQDVSYLAHAAREVPFTLKARDSKHPGVQLTSTLFAVRALHNPNATNQAPSDPITGPVDPAQHYFYFFENDQTVANFVADTFRSIASCADGHDCPYNIVFCGDRAWPNACSTPAGRYGFVRDPNQNTAALNNRPKGGGSVFMCDAGLALPRNPTPCSTAGGADSIGYALLVELLQVDVITRPDVTLLQQKAGIQNITDLHTDGSPWTLNELGFGTNGDGLRAKGIANAENYARFASWSWDLGFGGAPWTGETCEQHWAAVVRNETLAPFG